LYNKDYLRNLYIKCFGAPLVQTIVNVIFQVVLIPVLINIFCNDKKFVVPIVVVSVYIVFLFLFWLANHIKHEQYKDYLVKKEFITKIQVLEDTMSRAAENVIENSENKDLSFEAAAQLICNCIYSILKIKTGNDVEVRISVVSIMTGQNENKYSFVGYKSDTTEKAKKKIASIRGCKHYFKTVYNSNNEEYVFLNEEQINKDFYFSKDKGKSKKLKEYFAYPVKSVYDKTTFILQIDFNKENCLGKNSEEKRIFINTYVRPFVLRLLNVRLSDSIIANNNDN